jgi:dTDP-4-amino-4,6-dideoxygalactose transaminase
VIPVDLFGQPADHCRDSRDRRSRKSVRDRRRCAGFGATYRNRKIGTVGAPTGTSFFPAKPLGCYGDGGAIFTDDDDLAEVLRSIRVHGEGRGKYDCVRIGMNGRFDTIQAAVLIEKLKIFPDEIAARARIAARYSAALADVTTVPRVAEGATSVWAQYTIRVAPERRESFAATLKAQGIPTAIHYPKPVHGQSAYAGFPVAEGGLPVSERLAKEVISLPMHAYLEEPVQDRIIAAVRAGAGRVAMSATVIAALARVCGRGHVSAFNGYDRVRAFSSQRQPPPGSHR